MGFIGFWEKSIASKTADGSAFSQGSLGPKKVAPTDPKTLVVFSPINQWVPSYEGHLWTSVRREGKAYLCWEDKLLRMNCFSQICIEKGIRYSETEAREQEEGKYVRSHEVAKEDIFCPQKKLVVQSSHAAFPI